MSWGTQLSSCWDEYRPTKMNDESNAMMKVIQALNRDCKRSNNTSKEIEIKRHTIANTQKKSRFEPSSASPPSPLWRISLCTKGSSTKGPYNNEL